MATLKKVTVIIQARTGARRLLDKVLLKLADKTVLEHVIARAGKAKTVDRVVVATTVCSADLKIVSLVSRLGVGVFCGSETDVLDRYYQAARLFDAKHIVRVTADCPVIDPKIIDKTVAQYFKSGADYCSNALSSTFPDGQDVEVFSFDALARAWHLARLDSEREHVTPFIWKNNHLFKIARFESRIDYSAKRWTLDEPRDFQFLKTLYRHLYRRNRFFGMDEILKFLKKNPRVELINSTIGRNEGYQKSVKEDRKTHVS